MAKQRPSHSALFVLALFAVFAVMFLITQAQKDSLRAQLDEVTKTNPSAEQQRENTVVAQKIVDDVRAMYEIPTGTQPTVAKIVDVETLRARDAFYNAAENGDYVIITADRAILYDADAEIILDVAPIPPPAPQK